MTLADLEVVTQGAPPFAQALVEAQERPARTFARMSGIEIEIRYGEPIVVRKREPANLKARNGSTDAKGY